MVIDEIKVQLLRFIVLNNTYINFDNISLVFWKETISLNFHSFYSRGLNGGSSLLRALDHEKGGNKCHSKKVILGRYIGAVVLVVDIE